MKIKLIASALFLFSATLSTAQKNDPVIAVINNEPIYQSEFLNIYTKNNPNPSYEPKVLDEHMELFIKYKLKVAEAKELKMDTASHFIREIAGYQKQLEAPYLIDQETNDELLKEAYEHTVNEVKAAHILIQNVNGVQATRGQVEFGEAEKNKILDIRKEVLNGEITFEEAATKYSQDPSAKMNAGMLGYFSAFQMVYPFEEAAFNTPVGEISMPIATQFGYHIIKVYDKRPAKGKIRVAHIYIKSPKSDTETQKNNAEQKINEIYNMLEAGGDFRKLVAQFSDDKTSAGKGGELEWFSTGRMLPEFEEAAFALKNNGDYSKPVKTSYGYHIIKRLDYDPLPGYQEMEGELKQKIARDVRSNKSKESFIEKLKKEYKFKDKSKKWMAKYQATNQLDSASRIAALKALDTKKAFKIKTGKFKRTFTVSAFNEYTQYKKSEDIQEDYNRFVSTTLFDTEKTRLPIKYPEYQILLQEYKDGILLFELTNEKVWRKAIADSAGLEAFFEQNKEKYQWKKRANVEIYSAVEQLNIEKARKMALEGKNGYQILTAVNATSQLNLSLESGIYEIENKPELQKIELKEGVNPIFKLEDKFYFIKVIELIPAGQKELKEARGAAVTDYQNTLEKEWLKNLKEKYPVEIKKEVLYNLGKK